MPIRKKQIDNLDITVYQVRSRDVEVYDRETAEIVDWIFSYLESAATFYGSSPPDYSKQIYQAYGADVEVGSKAAFYGTEHGPLDGDVINAALQRVFVYDLLTLVDAYFDLILTNPERDTGEYARAMLDRLYARVKMFHPASRPQDSQTVSAA